MSTLVVDASVVAKWFFPEEHSAACLRLLAPRHHLLAPDLIYGEVGNVVWKRFQRGETSAEEARGIAADLLRLPLIVTASHKLLTLAVELALSTGRSVYDSLYVALAVGRKCRLITGDERLFNALQGTPLAKYVRCLSQLR